jgi:hypothetical protein
MSLPIWLRWLYKLCYQPICDEGAVTSQFLISDRGIHFTADAFQRLAKESEFVHVVVARHTCTHSQMELRNVLSARSRSGWRIKPGNRIRNYWNFYACFCRNITTVRIRVYPFRGYLPMNMPIASGFCSLQAFPDEYKFTSIYRKLM